MQAELNNEVIQIRHARHSTSSMVCCVIPAYRASRTICQVVNSTLKYSDAVIVVDDACPEGSGVCVARAFARDTRVHIIGRAGNGGVGAAVKDGIAKALALEADVIVKIDADGQMDPSYIPTVAELLQNHPDFFMVKGNRLLDQTVIKRMPAVRLLGNSVLSLLVKFASGYWNMLDPTNGYVAFNANLLKGVNWQLFADRYFFEISVLCELGIKHAGIAEVDMPAIYGSEPSSLSISRTLLGFPPKLAKKFIKRIVLQYFIFDVNVASLYLFFGMLLALFGFAFGSFEWAQSNATGIPRPTGTVMLAAVTFLMGFQLVMNALLYDVQFGPKVERDRRLQDVGQKTRRRLIG